MGEDSRAAAVRAMLERHVPADHRERRSLRTILAYLGWLRRPFDEDADPVHVTVSAIVVDPPGRVLLHRHRRLGIWLQPGGHVEDGESLPDAVLRETLEESGIAVRHPAGGPELLHVDVHEGGSGHLHLDLRWRLDAPAEEPRPGDGESQEVLWLEPVEAANRSDLSLRNALVRAGLLAPTPPRSGGASRPPHAPTRSR